MILIQDNVLDINNLALIQEKYFCNQPHYECNWIDKELVPEYFNAIIDKIKNHINVENYVGIEWWTQKDGSMPIKGWHYDVDENLWQTQHQIKTPLCSLIFYPLIENLQGGQLKTETTIITPQTNRLIMLSPQTLHNVQNYSGTRWSLLINLWDYKL